MIDEHDLSSIFRRIGSTGFIIFERDGLLLRRKDRLSDLTLEDVDEGFVDMLRRLRDLNLRFGFVSDQRGTNARSYGRSEFTALTSVLDGLLMVHEATPDFWMAWDSPLSGTEIRHRDVQPIKPIVSVIRRATEWYSVDKKKAVFVSSSLSGVLAAHQANIRGISYSSWRNDNETELRRYVSASETTEVQRLGAMIEQISRLNHRRTG